MNKFKVETYKSTEGGDSLLVLKAGDITLVSRCGTYWSTIDDSIMGDAESVGQFMTGQPFTGKPSGDMSSRDMSSRDMSSGGEQEGRGYEVGARYIMLSDDHPWLSRGCIFEVEKVISDEGCFTKCNNLVSASRLINGEVIKLEFHPMKFRVMNVSHYYKLMGELTAHGYRFKHDSGGFINVISDVVKYLFTDTEGIIKWSGKGCSFEEDEREECKLVNGTHRPHLHKTANIVVK